MTDTAGFFRRMAMEELVRAEALVPPPRSDPPKPDELVKVISISTQKLTHMFSAYLHLTRINDPSRQEIRDKTHQLLDVMFDAGEEMQRAK
jgi:hypothetical protein